MDRKKTYRNYLSNQAMRRENPNIRKIVNGEPVTFWEYEEDGKSDSRDSSIREGDAG